MLNMTTKAREEWHSHSFHDCQYMNIFRYRRPGTSAGQPQKRDRWEYNDIRYCSAPYQMLTRMMLKDMFGTVDKGRRLREATYMSLNTCHQPGSCSNYWTMRHGNGNQLDIMSNSKYHFGLRSQTKLEIRVIRPIVQKIGKTEVPKQTTQEDKQQTKFGWKLSIKRHPRVKTCLE